MDLPVCQVSGLSMSVSQLEGLLMMYSPREQHARPAADARPVAFAADDVFVVVALPDAQAASVSDAIDAPRGD